MQRWFSALDDAIIQRQWRQTPRTRSLVIPRPRGPARRPGRGSSGGSHAALAAAPRPPGSCSPHRRRPRSRACGRTGACLVTAASNSRSAARSPKTSPLRAGRLPCRGLCLRTDPFRGPARSRAMSRKRPRLVPETLGLKRRRDRGPAEADPLRGVAGSARAAVAELVRLFPRGLFEDALPPIVLRSQVYSLVPDRTAADRQLKELQEQREIRVVQLGFDLDAHGIILTEDYRTIVLKACDGRSYAGAVQKFLASVLPACGDLSFQQDQMTQTFGFRDTEITQLVNAGVLTVRDAGSWWLAVPGAGRFIKYFVKGRQAVLGMVRKAKYRELLLSELLGRRAPASVRLGLAYHVHDLIGAQLVDCVSTTSGTLLRLPEI